MAKSHGYRSGTRHSFARSFRKRGAHIPLTTYLTKYRVGDYVDVVANGAVHKGMPHKTYHGKTGIVYNVSRRALGVEINKQVRNRIIKKRINVRVEHVNQSKCRTDFLDRVKQNERIKREYKLKNERAPITLIKRFPGTPKDGYFVAATSSAGAPQYISPLPHDEMV